MTKPIRVLVVDDSPIFSEVICGILGSDFELDVIGVAGDGRQALEMTARLRPDVITMDIHLPD